MDGVFGLGLGCSGFTGFRRLLSAWGLGGVCDFGFRV